MRYTPWMGGLTKWERVFACSIKLLVSTILVLNPALYSRKIEISIALNLLESFRAHLGREFARRFCNGASKSVRAGLMDSTPGSEDPTSSLLDSLDVQLRVLPNKLRIGQIARGGLPAAAFPLLNLVLFPDPEYVHLTHRRA